MKNIKGGRISDQCYRTAADIPLSRSCSANDLNTLTYLLRNQLKLLIISLLSYGIRLWDTYLLSVRGTGLDLVKEGRVHGELSRQ